MRGPHPRPSDVDVRLAGLDAIIASAMSLAPASRPQHADDLARPLRKFLSDVDLGDVARQLGERVRRVRVHPPPAAEQGPALQRPASRPTAMQVGTKTFAARDEVGAWPAAAGPSTRKLTSNAPPAIGARATRPTFALGLLSRGGMAAGAIGVVAFLIGRSAAVSTAAAPADSAGLTGVASRGGTAAATVNAAAVGQPQPPGAQAPAAAGGATPADTTTTMTRVVPPAAAASASNADAPERAQLQLLGDGTQARVDGLARGASPVRLTLEPGTHSVVFTFPATGESKGTSVTLRPGERATVRADFTGPEATIRVQR